MVGANTLCPFFSRRSATRRQHQPPCQAPCTSTKVLRACASAGVAPSAAAPAVALAVASTARRVIDRSLVSDMRILPVGLVGTIVLNCSGLMGACRGLRSHSTLRGNSLHVRDRAGRE